MAYYVLKFSFVSLLFLDTLCCQPIYAHKSSRIKFYSLFMLTTSVTNVYQYVKYHILLQNNKRITMNLRGNCINECFFAAKRTSNDEEMIKHFSNKSLTSCTFNKAFQVKVSSNSMFYFALVITHFATNRPQKKTKYRRTCQSVS